jgi:hypothetical protein
MTQTSRGSKLKRHSVFAAAMAAAVVLPVMAQVAGPINPSVPPRPLAQESASSATEPSSPPARARKAQGEDLTPFPFPMSLPQPPPPDLPERVALPAGRTIAVLLDTALSTRIAKKGQVVTFHTSGPIQITNELEIPPESQILARVTQVKRPGHFGKAGVLRVAVESLHLDPGGVTKLDAHLDSADMRGGGRLTTDNRRSTDLYTVLTDSIQGTLLGTVVAGGKGAAIGAGAGGAIAVLIMMSHRGPDIYLEPGMPFTVILNQTAYLAGGEVYQAQTKYEQTLKSRGESSSRDARREEDDGGPPRMRHRRPTSLN